MLTALRFHSTASVPGDAARVERHCTSSPISNPIWPDVPAFKVRPGYRVTRALPAKKIKNIRFLQFSPRRQKHCSSPAARKVLSMRWQSDGDGVYQVCAPVREEQRSVQGILAAIVMLYFRAAV